MDTTQKAEKKIQRTNKATQGDDAVDMEPGNG